MNSSIEKAYAYITSGIASGAWPKGTRMPTVMQLKKDAHVSKKAMLAAVKQLKEETVLSVSRKSGIFVGGPLTYSTQPQLMIKWQMVRRRILQDILEKKILMRGVFPSIADIRNKYGASFRSCKKALESLVTEKVIEHDTRGYRIAQLSMSKNNTTIALYAIGDDDEVSVFNTRILAFLAQIQRSCNEAGITLLTIGVAKEVSKTSSDSATPLARGTFGAILYTNGLSREKCEEVITLYKGLKLPLAVFDEIGDFLVSTPILPTQRLKIFTIAAWKAGAAIGDFLLKQGHRKIIYFPSYSTGKQRWSQLRLRGLREAFGRSGFDGSVINATELEPPLPLSGSVDAQSKYMGVDAALHRKVIGQMDAARKSIINIINTVRGGFFNNHALIPAYLAIWTSVTHEEECHNLLPAMQTALSDSAITAWVGHHDMMALSLSTFLSKANVAVPKKIAIVGFDNSVDSHEGKLTSYDFDVPSIAHKAVQYIVNPAHELFQASDIIECEGIIMERRTTQIE